MYIQVIAAVQEYEGMTTEGGIVGEYEAEQKAKGLTGEMGALNLLTRCLIKLVREEEAATHVEWYLSLYAGDADHPSLKGIRERIEKARRRKARQTMKRPVNFSAPVGRGRMHRCRR
jgi:hypothetical protein